MATEINVKLCPIELIETISPYVGLLKLPYLGMNPTKEFCYQVELNCEAAPGDLGNFAIQRSLVRHTKFPNKQGSLAASFLEFLLRKREEMAGGLIPSIEATYKVAHRERVRSFPDIGEETEVQTRTVCAPEGGVKIWGAYMLQ